MHVQSKDFPRSKQMDFERGVKEHKVAQRVSTLLLIHSCFHSSVTLQDEDTTSVPFSQHDSLVNSPVIIPDYGSHRVRQNECCHTTPQ